MRTIDAIEKIGVRAETLKYLVRALEDTSQMKHGMEKSEAIVERLYSLFGVLEDELNLLDEDIATAIKVEGFLHIAK